MVIFLQLINKQGRWLHIKLSVIWKENDKLLEKNHATICNNKIRVSELITINEVLQWEQGANISISSGTGAGKSFFCKNTLYEIAKNSGQKILMFIHRSNCVNQFINEIKRDGKDDVIDIITYQKLESDKLRRINTYDLSKYRYLICDEFHYFFNDSSFNNKTAVSFETIINEMDCIKVFMSATGDDMNNYMSKYIKDRSLPNITKYDIPKDFSFISNLTFYNNDATVESVFIKEAIEKNQKAIVFIQSAEKAYKLYCKFKKYCVFNCGTSSKFYKYVDADKITQILNNQKFEELILITTSCFDAGINIIDTELKHIIIDITDIGSLIQCMGRKRIQSEDDKVFIYIKTINNQRLSGLRQTMRRQIEMADYFIDSGFSVPKLISKYPRTNDKTDIVYDDYMEHNGESYYTKRVNDLMYWKKKVDIATFTLMMEKYGQFGFCKYLARIFGFYNEETGHYNYRTIIEDDSLEYYLQKIEGQVMLQKPDRKELINKVDARSGGKRLNKIDSLNEALEKRKLNYQIVQFATSRNINQVDTTTGEIKKVKKTYKQAWRVMKMGADRL